SRAACAALSRTVQRRQRIALDDERAVVVARDDEREAPVDLAHRRAVALDVQVLALERQHRRRQPEHGLDLRRLDVHDHPRQRRAVHPVARPEAGEEQARAGAERGTPAPARSYVAVTQMTESQAIRTPALVLCTSIPQAVPEFSGWNVVTGGPWQGAWARRTGVGGAR